MSVELEELLVKDAAEWRTWLESNHADSPGVWLVLHKKGGAVTELEWLEEDLRTVGDPRAKPAGYWITKLTDDSAA